MIVSNFRLLSLEFHLVHALNSKLRSSNECRGQLTLRRDHSSHSHLWACLRLNLAGHGRHITYLHTASYQWKLVDSLPKFITLTLPGTKAKSRGRTPTHKQGWGHHCYDHNWHSVAWDHLNFYKGTLHCVCSGVSGVITMYMKLLYKMSWHCVTLQHSTAMRFTCAYYYNILHHAWV